MATQQSFRLEQRALLGDLDQTTYSDVQLDLWSGEEIGTLWSLGLFKRATNRGSEPTIRQDHNTLLTRYYSFPSGWRRISEVEFVSGRHVQAPDLTLTTATTGGSLAAGLYVYRLTLTDSVGESWVGNAKAIVVPSGTSTNTVTLTWSPVTVAAAAYAVTTGYKVYIGTTPALLTTITPNSTATYLHTTGTGSGSAPTTDGSSFTVDEGVGRSTGFDDLEDGAANIRIEEAPAFEGFKIRMFGESEYSGITDSAIRQEVLDVVLYGSVVRALTGELLTRVQASRSLVSTNNLDTSSGALSLAVNTMQGLYKRKIAKALAVQARTSLVR